MCSQRMKRILETNRDRTKKLQIEVANAVACYVRITDDIDGHFWFHIMRGVTSDDFMKTADTKCSSDSLYTYWGSRSDGVRAVCQVATELFGIVVPMSVVKMSNKQGVHFRFS